MQRPTFWKLWKSHTLLTVLLGIDIGFILLQVVRWSKVTPLLKSWRFSLANDWGFAEMFQYCQELLIIGLSIALFMRYRNAIYLAWTALFTYVLLDDSMKFHEHAGVWLGNHFSMQPVLGVRVVDMGELTFFGLVGVVVFSLMAIGYWLSAPVHRRVAIRMVGLLFIYAFCGGGFDFMHEMVVTYPVLELLVGIAEDGGEMLAMSLIAWYTYRLVFPQMVVALKLPRILQWPSYKAASSYGD